MTKFNVHVTIGKCITVEAENVSDAEQEVMDYHLPDDWSLDGIGVEEVNVDARPSPRKK